MKRVLTAAAGDPRSVAVFLAARLGLDPATARRWVELGAVSVAGRRAGLDSVVPPGARVVVRPVAGTAEAPGGEELPPVVFRDRHLLAVDKPAGMLSQPSPGERATSLEARVQRVHPGARLAHRLDRDTSGLVLFSLTP